MRFLVSVEIHHMSKIRRAYSVAGAFGACER